MHEAAYWNQRRVHQRAVPAPDGWPRIVCSVSTTAHQSTYLAMLAGGLDRIANLGNNAL